MEEDNFKRLMLTLTPNLNEHIRDMSQGIPRDNYDCVISQIKDYFTPVCNRTNCRYKIKLYGKNLHFYPTLLHRQTYKICSSDKCRRNVSDYSHSVCYKHTDVYHQAEYAYHHTTCKNA